MNEDDRSNRLVAAYHLGVMSDEVRFVENGTQHTLEVLRDGRWSRYISGPSVAALVEHCVEHTEL